MIGEDRDVALLQRDGSIVWRQLHRPRDMRLGKLQFSQAARQRRGQKPGKRILRHLRQRDIEGIPRGLDVAQGDESAGAVKMGLALFDAVGQTARQRRVEAGAGFGRIAGCQGATM